MEKLLKTGKVKAIGVANYSLPYLEQLLPHVTVIPAVNQIENHPSLPQQEIVDFCKSKGVLIVAYSPLGSTGSPLATAAPIVEIAKRHNVTPVSVLLSLHGQCSTTSQVGVLTFLVARGKAVLAKSVTPERINANRNLVQLDESDLKLLDDYSNELTKAGQLKRYVYPPWGIDFGFPDKS
jgi:diketogulonate reductase-like aldo/keto reductase